MELPEGYSLEEVGDGAWLLGGRAVQRGCRESICGYSRLQVTGDKGGIIGILPASRESYQYSR